MSNHHHSMTTLYTIVGRYTKQTDPDFVNRLKEDGYKTTNKAVGQAVAESDPEMFDHLINDILGNHD